ncbi:MAG: hypothetical protein M0042_00735, partial [Nitrospiraceae bacterium]|nr:hypothetical protein [Nitrospiraceae bacterium]
MLLQSVLGLAAFIGLAWLVSEKRSEVRYRTALAGVAVQLGIAAVLLYVPAFKKLFVLLNGVVLSLEAATKAGTSF